MEEQATFYDVCNEIWGRYPATASLQHGVDTADFKVLNVTACDPRSINSPSATHVPDLNTSLSEESSEVESISRPKTPYSTCCSKATEKD